ncbi:AsmA family protein [Zavarzinia compransoris]|uniref:AsmA family protein n=1 Tax=Zavarzinia compransoris TaxID=1264899 RepID=UPI00105B63EB|nr:AsmA family protein [Zavarzinia compransoris]TDP46132.1 uncharacterized protein involved in outer membrane biogenesis [Zavarzinia compransoris]
MRKLLIGVGAVVGLVVGLGFAAPLLIDLNDQKPRIAALIEEATGHRVVLGGDIRFTVLPVPAVSVRNVRVLGREAAGPDLADVQAIDLRLSLIALLGGKVDVAEVRLSRPVVIVAEADLGAPAPAGETPAPAAAGGGGADSVSVQRVLIEDGLIEWRPAAGPARRLEGLEANISAPSLYGPYTVSGGASYHGQPVALDLALGRFTSGQLLAYDVRLALAGGTMALGGSLDPAAPGGPAVQGKLRLSIDDPAAIGALTGIQLPVRGTIVAEGALKASAAAVAIDDLAVSVGDSRGSGRLAVAFGPTTAVSLKLRMPRLDGDALLAAVQAPAAEAAADAAALPAPPGPALALPAGVTADVDLAIDALQWSGAVIQKIALVAALEGGKLTLSKASAVLPGATDIGLSGAAASRDGRPRFEGTVDVASDNPRALTDWLKLTPDGLPAGRLTRFTLTAKVSTDGIGAALSDLVVRLDGSTARGSAGWQPGVRPTAMLSLDIDRVDADDYLGLAAPAVPAPAAPANPLAEIGAAAPAAPWPDPGFDLALRLKLGSLTLHGNEVKAVDLDGLVTPDTLRLTTLAVADYAGLKLGASGKLGFAKEAPEGDFAFQIEAPSPQPLLALAGIAAPAGTASLGRLAVEGRLTGKPEAPLVDAWASVGETRLALAGAIGSLRQPVFDLKGTFSAPELLALAVQAGLSPAPAGPVLGPVDLAITLRGTADQPAVEANGRLGPADLSLAGAIGAEGYRIAAKLEAANGAAMLTRLGLTGAVSGPLALALEARGKAGELVLSALKATVGPNRIEAEGTLATAGSRRFTGRISAPYLDLALFGGGTGPAGAATPAPARPAGNRWSTRPIDIEGLRRFDGAIDLAADRLVAGSFTLSAVSARLTAAQGVLSLADLKATADPGAVNGTVTLDASGDALGIAAEIRATGFDLDALTGRKGAEPGLSGSGDLTLGLTGIGRSTFEIVSSLTGQGSLLATEGRIHGIDLKTLSDGLKTVNQPGDIIGRIAAAVKAGSTAYRRIATDLAVARGIVKLAGIGSDIDGGTLSGDGTVDLPAWNTRLRLALKLAEPADLPPLGIDISGPPDAPGADVRSRDIENYYLQKFIGSKLPDIPGLGGGGGGGRDPGKAIVDQIFKGLGGK